MANALDRASELLQEIEDRETGIYNESQSRQTADTAETNARTTAVANLQTQVDGKASLAALDSESSTRATADTAETNARTTAISNLQTQVDGKATTAALNSESSTRATNDTAETNARTAAISNLQTQVDGKASTAALNSEASTRASADTAETNARTTAISSLQTQVDAKASTAYVDNLNTTRATETTALARTVASLMATVNESSAYVQILSDAFVDANGNAIATWGFSLNANGVVTSMKAIAQSGDLCSENFTTMVAGWKIFGSAGNAEFAGTFRVGSATNYLSFTGSAFELKVGTFTLNASGGLDNSAYATNSPSYGRTRINLPSVAVISGPPYTQSVSPGELEIEYLGSNGATHAVSTYGIGISMFSYSGSGYSRTLYVDPFGGMYCSHFEGTTQVFDYKLNDTSLFLSGNQVVGTRKSGIANPSADLGSLTSAVIAILNVLRPTGHGLISS